MCARRRTLKSDRAGATLSSEKNDPEAEAEAQTLASRWPRALIEQGAADALAESWTASRRAALAAGLPPFARHPLTPELVSSLFEARRSRRLVRGLEAAEEALAAQAAGVRSAVPGPEGRPSRSTGRISRLILISVDGSDRFYRNINQIVRKYGETVEVLVVLCDELELGATAFGRGQRARALLVEHKEAVVRVLGCLREFDPSVLSSRSPAGIST